MILKRKIGPKGQIVIPKDVREILNVRPGDEIIIEIKDKEIKLKAVEDGDLFLKNFTDVPKKLEKTVDIEQIIDQQYDTI